MKWNQHTDNNTGLFFWGTPEVISLIIHQVKKPSPGFIVTHGNAVLARCLTLQEAKEWCENRPNKFDKGSAS